MLGIRAAVSISRRPAQNMSALVSAQVYAAGKKSTGLSTVFGAGCGL
jgi:hypothetical protein